jgi:hypothetical protein
MLMLRCCLELFLLDWAISLSSNSPFRQHVSIIRLYKSHSSLLVLFNQHFFQVFPDSFRRLLTLSTWASLFRLLSLGCRCLWPIRFPIFFVVPLSARYIRWWGYHNHWLHLLMLWANSRLIRLRRTLRWLIKQQLSFWPFVCWLRTYVLGHTCVHTGLGSRWFHGSCGLLRFLILHICRRDWLLVLMISTLVL